MTLQVIYELWKPFGGAYTVDTAPGPFQGAHFRDSEMIWIIWTPKVRTLRILWAGSWSHWSPLQNILFGPQNIWKSWTRLNHPNSPPLIVQLVQLCIVHGSMLVLRLRSWSLFPNIEVLCIMHLCKNLRSPFDKGQPWYQGLYPFFALCQGWNSRRGWRSRLLIWR